MSKIYYDKTLGKLRDENDSSGGSGGATREYVNEVVATHNDSAEAHAALLAVKVDKEPGKGLSANDYTTAEKEKLAGLSNYDDSGLWSQVTEVIPANITLTVSAHNTAGDAHAALFAAKVDKEPGKGLSANDYTTADKNKLAGLANYDDTGIRQELAGKATPADIALSVSTHNTADNAHTALFAAKVDKVTGKALSSNDYTTVEKNKLAGLANYDDSGLRSELAAKATPAEIAEAVGTHNEAATAHSALFSVKADAADVESALALKADVTALSTKADLVNGRVPASQLPDVVSPIVEVPTLNDLPETGDSNTIYVTLDTNQTYRWGGSEYVEISKSLALGETPETAFAGNRGLALEAALPGKVDKVTGKSLLADTEITRLAGVDNYDDTELKAEVAAKAPLASPAFTGSPTAPAQTAGDSSTKIANTAFVTGGIATHNTAASPHPGKFDASGTASSTVATHNTASDAHSTLFGAKAPLASPAFTGSPTTPTQTAGDSSTKIANTAFVTGGIATHNAAASPHPGKFDASGTASSTVATHNTAADAHSTLFGARLPLAGGTMTGQLVLSTIDGMRHKYSNYGVIYRNDGGSYYILVTAQGDPNGTWTSARPFVLNLASGTLNINGSANSAANDSAGNPISTTYAKNSAFINPGSASISETIYVGPTRAYTTLSAALAYAKTKQFTRDRTLVIQIDAGTYNESSFSITGCYITLSATDSASKPVINFSGLITLYRHACLVMNYLTINFSSSGGLNVNSGSIVSGAGCSFSTTSAATVTNMCVISSNAIATFNSCSFINNSSIANTVGLYYTENSYGSLTNCTITKFHNGVYGISGAFVTIGQCTIDASTTSGLFGVRSAQGSAMTLTSSSTVIGYSYGLEAEYGSTLYAISCAITNCSTAGRAYSGSYLRVINVTLTNTPNAYSPAVNTVGNSNSLVANS